MMLWVVWRRTILSSMKVRTRVLVVVQDPSGLNALKTLLLNNLMSKINSSSSSYQRAKVRNALERIMKARNRRKES